MIELLPSKRGQVKLALNGFNYTKHYEREERVMWRCQVRSCQGRISTDAACLHAEVLAHHRHPPDHARNAMDKFKAMFIKRLAEMLGTDQETVIKTSVRKLPLAEAGRYVYSMTSDADKEHLASEEECTRMATVCMSWKKKRLGGVIKTDDVAADGDEGDNVADVFQTKRGFTKLLLNGYFYTKKRTAKDKIQWSCTLRNCRGRASSDLESLQAQCDSSHNHPPDPQSTESIRVRTRLKEVMMRPESAYRSYGDVVDEVLSGVSEEMRAASILQRKTLIACAKSLAMKHGLKRMGEAGKHTSKRYRLKQEEEEDGEAEAEVEVEQQQETGDNVREGYGTEHGTH